MDKKICNTKSCKDCLAIRGKLYCGKSVKELANGKRKELLFVKQDAPCYYDK